MSLIPSHVNAIILDVFDTVLLRDDVPPQSPYIKILMDLGIENPKIIPPEDYHTLLTTRVTFTDFIDHYAPPHTGRMQRLEFLRNAEQVFAAEQESYYPRPEWQEFLQQARARDLTICLGSNLSQPYTRIVDEKLGHDVAHRVYSCDINKRKPHAAFFHACCDIMNSTPEQTIMIGNSFSSDIKGAENAGLAQGFWIPRPTTRDGTHHGAIRLQALTDIFTL